MFKVILLAIAMINTSDRQDICTDELVDKAFDTNFIANYYLFIPVKDTKGDGRLFIFKDKFIKYLIATDSLYNDINEVKKYTKDILANKKKFSFDEPLYIQKFKKAEYRIRYDKNKYDSVVKQSATDFLKKYITFYNENGTYFNPNYDIPLGDHFFVYEQFFRLNLLVVEGDGRTSIYRAKCKK